MAYSYLKRGDYDAYCDICGQRYKASQLRARWDGAMVCRKDWETRNPQDFAIALADPVALPWIRPAPTPVYVTDFCTIYGRSSYAGLAVATCMVAGLLPGLGLTVSESTGVTPPPPPVCTRTALSGIVGYGVVGCMTVGNPTS